MTCPVGVRSMLSRNEMPAGTFSQVYFIVVVMLSPVDKISRRVVCHVTPENTVVSRCGNFSSGGGSCRCGFRRPCDMTSRVVYDAPSFFDACPPLFRGASSVVTGVVKPDNVVVFYPTRYDANSVGANVACPVSAFFAEYDNSPGATVEDARTLLEQLLNNDDVSGWLAGYFDVCPILIWIVYAPKRADSLGIAGRFVSK